MRVYMDGTAFMQHRRSGISRYVAELVEAFDRDPSLGIEPVTPYRWITNVHADGSRRGFRALPLPRRFRRPVLDRLNRGHARQSGRTDVAHYPLYDDSLLEKATHLRSITTVYDFTFEVFPHLFSDQTSELDLKRRFLEACDVLVCISESTASDLRRFHPQLDKPVFVTPLAVAPQFSHPRRSPLRSLPERYLLHVGNRAQHKNVELLFRAFRVLSERYADLQLVLTGAGLPGEADHLRRLGIAERTHFRKLTDAELPTAYHHAAAFVFPSRYEGFGLPLVEAMAAGCPTLISTAPALLEVAGEAAVVVDPDDLDGAIAGLERILGDQRHASDLRAAGRTRAADFTWHRTAQLTARAYRTAKVHT